jgi:hypothetical protein
MPLGQACEYALVSLFKRAEKLQGSLRTGEAEMQALLGNMQTNAAYLRTRWQEWARAYPEEYTGTAGNDAYLRSLERDYDLLRKAEQELEKPPTALALLGIVDADIQVKADHCRQSRSGLGRTIQVLVRTRHGSAEAPGYEVWYVQRGYYGTKRAQERFKKKSSPTDERGLAPGAYAFWVKKGREASEPTTVRLGGGGEERVEVDLEVP